MMDQPPLIRYNLKERGRTFRGNERNFDIQKVMNAINSPNCQEHVKMRGMVGYFGHWVRMRFGLEPPEGGISEGKAHSFEPALVTTYLKAYPNGDVEHKTEFLDNPTGQMVARLYKNKVGGFSSTINEKLPKFYGFDWVLDPNYSTNRGYDLTFDSVSNGGITLDEIVALEAQENILAMNQLLQLSEQREEIALDCANRLRVENDQLLTMLEEQNEMKDHFKNSSQNRLDQFNNDLALFDSTSHLPKFKEPEKERNKAKKYNEYLSLKNHITGR